MPIFRPINRRLNKDNEGYRAGKNEAKMIYMKLLWER